MKKLLTVFATLAILAIITVVIVNAQADRRQAYNYTDTGYWYVTSGDTLWTIAGEHSDNRHDRRKVIDELYKLNPGLTPNIQPGDTIIVPLYDCMDKWEYYEEGTCNVPLTIEADCIEENRWLVLTVYDKATGEYIQSYDIDLWNVSEYRGLLTPEAIEYITAELE